MIGLQDSFIDIIQIAEKADSANNELLLSPFYDVTASIQIVVLNSFNNVVKSQIVAEKLFGLDFDQVLFDITTEGINITYPG